MIAFSAVCRCRRMCWRQGVLALTPLNSATGRKRWRSEIGSAKMASENPAYFLLGSCSIAERYFDCPDAGFSKCRSLLHPRETHVGHF